MEGSNGKGRKRGRPAKAASGKGSGGESGAVYPEINQGRYSSLILAKQLKPLPRDKSKKGLEQFGEGWREMALDMALEGLSVTTIRYYALGRMTRGSFDWMNESNEEFMELVEIWLMAAQCYMEAMGSENILDTAGKRFNNALYMFFMKNRFRDDYGDDMSEAVRKALEKMGVAQPEQVMTQEQLVKIAAAIKASAHEVNVGNATIN